MQINIDHINMTVASLEESVEWYRAVFGFDIVESGFNKESDGGQSPWCILKKNRALLCLYEAKNRVGPDEVPEKFHKMYHFGVNLGREDKGSWLESISKNKLQLFYADGAVEYPYSESWYVKDPTGYTIEVSYWPDGYRFK